MPKTRGKIKQMLEAAGVEVKEGDWDFDPQTLVGKKVRIHVGEKQDYNDPSKTRLRVQGYTPMDPEKPHGRPAGRGAADRRGQAAAGSMATTRSRRRSRRRS